MLSVELSDLVVVDVDTDEVLVLPVVVLLELPVFVFADVEVFLPFDSVRAFLSALIL